MIKYKPNHAYVLIRPLVKREESKLHLPEHLKLDPDALDLFEVMAVGPGLHQDGAVIPCCVSEGDIVTVTAAQMPMFVDPQLGCCILIMDYALSCTIEGLNRAAYRHMTKVPRQLVEPVAQ